MPATVERMRATRPGRLVLDALLAAVVLMVSLGAMSHGGWDRGEVDRDARDLDGLGVGFALLMALPLAARRVAPIPVFVAVTIATGALYGLGYGFPPLAFAIALYTVARWTDDTRPNVRNAVLAGSVVVLLAPSLVRHGLGPEVFFGAVVWAVAWFAGDRIRQRRERAAAAEERARQAGREAERERRLASAEERTRIARDLHDSAGHAVSVILVQAGAARLLLEQDPARSRAAIETIEDVARDTLVEIDQLVRALRETTSPDAVEPPAGLAAVDTLVERSRAAGLDVEVTVEGSRRALSPAVDQAAFRILREALTNAARHGAGRAEVELRFAPAAFEIAVSNPVAPEPSTTDGGGHGLVGMRERALLLGGTLEAAAVDGTFRVRASLPYRDGA
jgi:signal transduction histidine kinase